MNYIRVRWKTVYEACIIVPIISSSSNSSSNLHQFSVDFPSTYSFSHWNKHDSQFLESVNLWFTPGFAAGCVTLSKPLSFCAPLFLSVKGRSEHYNLKYSTTLSFNFISSGLCSFKRTTTTKNRCITISWFSNKVQ